MHKKRKFDILVVIIMFLLCIGFTYKTFQNDTFYTISIGKDILKYGVDMIDHFSIHSIPYTYPHWLYDLIIYLIYSIGGFKGIYIFTIILYFILGNLLYFFNKKLTNNQFISGVFAVIAVIFLPEFVTARAQLVTYVLFIIQMFFIELFLNKGSKKYLISFPIISLLIVNLHCAVWPFFFILFMPSIVEYLICLYRDKEIKIKKLFKPSGNFLPCKQYVSCLNEKIILTKNKNVKYLILVMFLSILCGFITLNGNTPFVYFIKTMQGDTTSWILEHLAPILKGNISLIFYLTIFIFILSFIKTKIKLRELFLVLGLFILAFSSYRHISLLIILGTFVLARIVSNYLEEKNSRLSCQFIKIITNKILFPVFIFLFLLVSLSNYYGQKHNINNQKYIGEEYPVKAADFIIDNLDLKEIKLYNEYNYGSYLLFRGIPVFIDSRADLYTSPFNGLKRDITKDLNDVELNYEEIFDYYDITHVLIYRYNSEFGKTVFYDILDLNKNYNIIYEDERYALFERKNNK